VSLAFLVIPFSIATSRKKYRGRHLPGPRALPFIDNILDLPAHSLLKTLLQWANEFGESQLAFRVLQNNLIILNIMEAVSEVLNKRKHLYSNRP
ncbi:hypothetical protein M422DRAFT_107444, partial [Sphaerobolus stellatus SS14]